MPPVPVGGGSMFVCVAGTHAMTAGTLMGIAVMLSLTSPALVSAALLLLAYVLSRPLLVRQQVARAVDEHAMLNESKFLEFNADGITISGEDWQTSRAWRHFKRWSEDARNFYLDVTGSGIAWVVPKSAMNAPQQELLRDCLRAIPGRRR